MKSSILFLHKPVLYIRHSRIRYVELTRVLDPNSKGGSMTRTFDLNLLLHDSDGADGVAITKSSVYMQFMSIETCELL